MRDRIHQLCPDMKPSMIDDFSKIAALLATQSSTLAPYLLDLEQALLADVTKKNLLNDASFQSTFFHAETCKRYKLLTDVLTAWSATNGFQPTLAKINYYLPPRVFRSLQAEGYLFKDKGSSLDHGEWTHAIQWYLISAANQHHPFLENNLANLYVALSEHERRSTIWNLIFDLSPRQANLSTTDFRCPANLHAALMSPDSQATYPILHAILSKQEARLAKRGGERRPDIERKNAVTVKKY